MDSDYWIIRRHPLGGYAAVHGFSSDAEVPKATDGAHQFVDVDAAFDFAWRQNSVYGVSYDREVWTERFGDWTNPENDDLIVDFDEV